LADYTSLAVDDDTWKVSTKYGVEFDEAMWD
jgi:hypothetical protein